MNKHKVEKQSDVLDRAPGNRQNAAQQEDRNEFAVHLTIQDNLRNLNEIQN